MYGRFTLASPARAGEDLPYQICIALIQRGRGTGPVKPRQPVCKNKVPIPAEVIWKMRGDLSFLTTSSYL
jgi:hypothetical protein